MQPDRFPTFRRLASTPLSLCQSAAASPLTARLARITTRGVLVVLILSALGFGSNLLSRVECDSDARSFVAYFYSRAAVPKPLRWLTSDSLRDLFKTPRINRSDLTAEWRVRAVVFPIRCYLPGSEVEPPWAYSVTHCWDCPFIVRVHYGCLAKDLYGQAGIREYFSFFGAHVLLSDWVVWQS